MTTKKSRRGGKRENSGRTPKWNSETTAIRIPAKFKKDLLILAKQWDDPESLIKPQTDLILLVEQLQKENQQLKEKLAYNQEVT